MTDDKAGPEGLPPFANEGEFLAAVTKERREFLVLAGAWTALFVMLVWWILATRPDLLGWWNDPSWVEQFRNAENAPRFSANMLLIVAYLLGLAPITHMYRNRAKAKTVARCCQHAGLHYFTGSGERKRFDYTAFLVKDSLLGFVVEKVDDLIAWSSESHTIVLVEARVLEVTGKSARVIFSGTLIYVDGLDLLPTPVNFRLRWEPTRSRLDPAMGAHTSLAQGEAPSGILERLHSMAATVKASGARCSVHDRALFVALSHEQDTYPHPKVFRRRTVESYGRLKRDIAHAPELVGTVAGKIEASGPMSRLPDAIRRSWIRLSWRYSVRVFTIVCSVFVLLIALTDVLKYLAS